MDENLIELGNGKIYKKDEKDRKLRMVVDDLDELKQKMIIKNSNKEQKF